MRGVDQEDLEDLSGHGTHVAGIIGAQGNNEIGISGVAWNIRLVSLRVFDSNGYGYLSDVKRAIDFATNENIPILNYSGGSSSDHNGCKKAIENYPGLFVCAAGNDNQDNDSHGYFPGNYNFDNLISVGAININGNRPTSLQWQVDENGKPQGSNYGATTVDIFAPGDTIVSTVPTSVYSKGYVRYEGTSMATPHVTGVAALMLSINPNLTPQQIKFFKYQ